MGARDRPVDADVLREQTLSDCDIVTTRVMDAPRARVFRAWADPLLLAQWWGPKGFSNTFHKFAFEPGGAWKFTMHGPDGTDYHNESEFVEMVAPERIVLDHLKPMHRFRVTATFDEAGEGKTTLTFRMTFDTAEECERVKHFVVDANEQNFDRLEAVLAGMR
jgi:uncharacterized protein YndB with AHSA1/START domain